MKVLDHIDLRLLRLLQLDADNTVDTVAKLAGISTAQCIRRIKRLKSGGYIKKIVATLNRGKLPLTIQSFVQITLDRRRLSDFVTAVKVHTEVADCYLTLGIFDALLRITCDSRQRFDEFYCQTLIRLPGVINLTVCTSLAEVKMTTVLPVKNSIIGQKLLRIPVAAPEQGPPVRRFQKKYPTRSVGQL